MKYSIGQMLVVIEEGEPVLGWVNNILEDRYIVEWSDDYRSEANDFSEESIRIWSAAYEDLKDKIHNEAQNQ